MRLHHLTVTAFGPFAGTEHVDFAALNEAGLFLLTGATGAGKSSLLDAVCFALYGTVPGARAVRTLPSQHAAPDTRPEVVLDFSVQGRRFVVRRSPEWSRRKRRGDGVVTEKASASIVETTSGTDEFLSSRAAEVGVLVGDLMGMSASQFQQVALLPQGEFQTFLRATSQERHTVLQQLFRTDRFARIEDWVHDRSRLLKERSSTGESSVRRGLDLVADRAHAELPDELCGDRLPVSAASGRVLVWVSGVVTEATAQAAVAARDRQRAQRVLERARARHEQDRRADERRRRLEGAERALSGLAATADDAQQARAALDAHERASRCAPLLDLVERAREQVTEAAIRRVGLRRSLDDAEPGMGGGADAGSREAAVAAASRVRARVARLEALAPRETAADQAHREAAHARTRLHGVDAAHEEAGTRASAVPDELVKRTGRLAEARSRAARLPALELELTTAVERRRACISLTEVGGRLVAADDGRREARDHAQDARASVQDLLARRLTGMAAELAGSLTEGDDCPVCGSREHPRPADPGDDAVSEADQLEAEELLASRQLELEAAVRAVEELTRRRDALVAVAGDRSVDQAAAEVAVLEARIAEARSAQQQESALEREIVGLRTEQESLGALLLSSASESASLRESLAAHERVIAAVAVEVARALGPDHDESVRDVAARLGGVLDLLDQLVTAEGDCEALDARLDVLVSQLATALAEHGFDPGDASDSGDAAGAGATGAVDSAAAAAAAALLPAATSRRLTAELAERAQVEARARAVLEDPALDDAEEPAADGGSPDQPGLPGVLEAADGSDVADAQRDEAAAARTHTLADERRDALTALMRLLETDLSAWAPLRDEALQAESLSRLVRGMGQDNQLQMRLSAYVLARRLDQVVEAANERLGHMRDHRYLLQRSDRAERRSAQAGLGLEVLDQWTGETRPPATLSGGETFVVSLALALGLADVVTQESGGTEVATLFVDEGFGTLDADTLDDVMDRLDGLRAGGRTVGVVSHVTELRTRIPTQVHVEKGRSGSTVVVRTLVG